MCILHPLDPRQLNHLFPDVNMKGGDAKPSKNCTFMTCSHLVEPLPGRPKMQNTHRNSSKVLLTSPRDIWFRGTHLYSDACFLCAPNPAFLNNITLHEVSGLPRVTLLLVGVRPRCSSPMSGTPNLDQETSRGCSGSSEAFPDVLTHPRLHRCCSGCSGHRHDTSATQTSYS